MRAVFLHSLKDSRLHLHPHVSQIKTKWQCLLIGGFFLCQKGGWALSAGFIKLMHSSFSLSACSVNTPHSISVSTHLISLIKTLKKKRLGLYFKGELVTGLVCSSQNRWGNTDTNFKYRGITGESKEGDNRRLKLPCTHSTLRPYRPNWRLIYTADKGRN